MALRRGIHMLPRVVSSILRIGLPALPLLGVMNMPTELDFPPPWKFAVRDLKLAGNSLATAIKERYVDGDIALERIGEGLPAPTGRHILVSAVRADGTIIVAGGLPDWRAVITLKPVAGVDGRGERSLTWVCHGAPRVLMDRSCRDPEQ
jgi:hypothetical protein